MTQFTGIGTETGYSDGTNNPFLVVPYRGINLLVLRNGKGYKVRPGDSRLGFDELSPKEVSDAAREYIFSMRYLGGEQAMDAMKDLWTKCRLWMSVGARLFSIRAKGTGLSFVEAQGKTHKLRVDVAILQRKKFKIAFQFLHHPDGAGTKSMTTWKPQDANHFVSQLNAIYVPQLNIEFELLQSKPIITHELAQPLITEVFERYVAQNRNPHADFNVFLVGKWAADSTHPNGTYFDKYKSAVICDRPVHPDEVTADPFILTLAHEAAHFLQYRRNLGGHHGRKKVLLCSGIQGTLIDKQLVTDLNPW